MITRWKFWLELAKRDPAFSPLTQYWQPADVREHLARIAEPLFRREARRLCKEMLAGSRDSLWWIRERVWLKSKQRKAAISLAAVHKRNAAKLNATPGWYGELDEFVTREAADLCRLRELATGVAWQVDHMVPLQAREACGLHCAANLQVIPARMNISKKNRMIFTEPFEWSGYLA